jgi:transcriptional regulator with XRE-family HTH domain
METADSATFADRLRKRREFERLSQAGLAAKAGLSPITVYRLETGDILPSVDSVIALAQVLDVCLDWFVLGRGPIRPRPRWTQLPTKKRARA